MNEIVPRAPIFPPPDQRKSMPVPARRAIISSQLAWLWPQGAKLKHL